MGFNARIQRNWLNTVTVIEVLEGRVAELELFICHLCVEARRIVKTLLQFVNNGLLSVAIINTGE